MCVFCPLWFMCVLHVCDLIHHVSQITNDHTDDVQLSKTYGSNMIHLGVVSEPCFSLLF